MVLESILNKIDFVSRYKLICEVHNDFENRLRGNDTKMYKNKLKLIDESVVYFPKDKMYKVCFKYNDSSLELGLQLNDGLVEARLFYTKNEEWLLYKRFDFICEELDSNYNRMEYNLPKYKSEIELEVILKNIFVLYENIKQELTNP